MAVLVQLVLIIGIFYFLFVLPQRREAKRLREMLAALKPGQEVATVGGVIGEIIHIKEDRITLRSGDSRLVVERARIARVLDAPSAPAS
jgi:preprotein translocase subunit YajC